MQKMVMMHDCGCTACAVPIGSVDERRVTETLRAVGRGEQEVSEIEWWVTRQGTPIDLQEIPRLNEQLFWDVVGLLMVDSVYTYHAPSGCVRVGGGKLVVSVKDRRRVYTCAAKLRSEYKAGDPLATEAVQLVEQMIFYMHADREQYECLRVNGRDLSVEVDYDREVVHIERGNEFYRYRLDDFVRLIGIDPLITDAAELLEEEDPNWRP